MRSRLRRYGLIFGLWTIYGLVMATFVYFRSHVGGRNPWTWVMLMIALGGQGRCGDATALLPELKKVAPHFDKKFIEDFLGECQEHKAILPPTFEALRSVWPEDARRESQGAEAHRHL